VVLLSASLYALYMVFSVPRPVETTLDITTKAIQFAVEDDDATLMISGSEIGISLPGAGAIEYTPADGRLPDTVQATGVRIRAGGGPNDSLVSQLGLGRDSKVRLELEDSPQRGSRVSLQVEPAARMEPLAMALRPTDVVAVRTHSNAEELLLSATSIQVRPSKVFIVDLPSDGFPIAVHTPLNVSGLAFEALNDARNRPNRNLLTYSAIESGVVRFMRIPEKQHPLGAGDRIKTSESAGWIRHLAYSGNSLTVRWRGTVNDIAIGGGTTDVDIAPTRMDIWYESRPWQPITAFLIAVAGMLSGARRIWQRTDP
jgi:hypothetical protein